MNLYNLYPSIVMRPQYGEIPLGVLYLAGELEHAGFDVVIKDNTIEHLPNDKLAEEIAALFPLFVGFSLLLFNVRSTRDVARLFKEDNPDIPVIFGGPHATIFPMKQALLNFVDIVITHQAEISLRDIAEQIRSGSFSPPREPHKKIIKGVPPNSLDDLALPARHLIDMNKYRRASYVLDVTPTDFICSSRGCPFQCAFCSSKFFWERKYFRRSAKLVVDEIEMLIEKYETKGIYFREDNFTVSRKHVISICEEIIKRNIKFKWECESRVDTISKDDLALMKKAGCAGIWCGVESGSQKILDSIMKGYKVEQVRDFFNWCQELEIPVAACFMLGLPGETAQDILETYELAVNLPAKWVQFATYIGFPKSEIYDKILKNSLWEACWEDVFITRNEHFTSSQLYSLEFAMNRDANMIANSEVNNDDSSVVEVKTRLLRGFGWYLTHPLKIPGKFNLILKTIFSGNTELPDKEPETFYQLLEKFSQEKQRSNP